jgi:outer membrane receptor protein involved in Fe transport
VRFEYYPGENQLLSVSGFYKKFENPIEQVMAQLGATTRERTFKNVKSAINYGLEIEARKNFGFINDNFKNLVAFANLALIQSSVDLEGTSSPNKNRPLQGQSPYVLNVGLQASFPDLGLNSTLVFNRVGDRVFEVGVTGYNDIYERHRNLLDFQIAKRIGKLAEIKLNWQDILRPDYIYYQDTNNDGKYQAPSGDFQQGNGEDNLIQRVKVGSTISLSFSMRF